MSYVPVFVNIAPKVAASFSSSLQFCKHDDHALLPPHHFYNYLSLLVVHQRPPSLCVGAETPSLTQLTIGLTVSYAVARLFVWFVCVSCG